MPEDRDRRRLITPPADVRARTAPESWEDGDGETPPLGVPALVPVPVGVPVPVPVPVEMDVPVDVDVDVDADADADAIGPEHVDAINKMSRRVKTTLQSTQATLDRVSELRSELDTVRLASARNEGKLDVLLDTLESERNERRQYTAVGVSSYQAQTELAHARAVARIANDRDSAAAALTARTERTAYRRALALKILAGVAAVWGVIATIVLAKCTT